MEMKIFKEKRAWRSRPRTILILPSSPEKRVISFSVPPVLWMISCALVFALPFLSGSGLWSLYRYKHMGGQTRQLEIENQHFKSKLNQQRQKIEHISRELLSIREKAGFIQDFLGLKSGGEQESKLGQGGIELSPRAFQPQSNLLSPNQNPTLSSHARNLNRTDSALRAADIQRLNTDLEIIISALEDRQKKLDSMPSISPVDPSQAWLSSAYGVRTSPFTGKKQFHPGVDLAGSKGTPILAPAKGKVAFVGKNGSLGLSIEIKHDSTFKTTYGHLLESAVKKGQTVERGEIIGYMGDTGRTTGYHLHYETEKNGKRVNPFDYMMDWGQNTLLLAGE
jgi:murein DD-endopeptidase MepM/ murein hydrolase activator NlpD